MCASGTGRRRGAAVVLVASFCGASGLCVDAARRTPKGPDRDARVREAEAQPTPACDELETRFGEARSREESLRKTRETPWRGAAWGSYAQQAPPRPSPAAAAA